MTPDDMERIIRDRSIVEVHCTPGRLLVGAKYQAEATFTDDEGRPVMPERREVFVHASRMNAQDVEACEMYLRAVAEMLTS